MKKILIPVFLFLLIACENSSEISNICPDCIKGKPENHLISAQDLNTVKFLFSSNNINLDNYRVYEFGKDDIGMRHVRCYQYVNNLNLLNELLIFHFDAFGKFKSLSGNIISDIDCDSIPLMDISDIKTMYLQKVGEDSAKNIDKTKIKNGCILCESGYYNVNAYISFSTPDFILAWKVKPEGSTYPFAYINDSAKTVIKYINGNSF
jgi:Zn-dependent metalloprotease